MIQNAEAASAQQTAAAVAAEHKAEKLDLKLADTQWELEQCQQQLKDKTAQAQHQMKVGAHTACLVLHNSNMCRTSLQCTSCMHVLLQLTVLQLCLLAT